MVYINVIVTDREYVTEPGDPEDRWDRDNTATEIQSVSAFITNEPVVLDWHSDRAIELDVKNGDEIHIVIARYSTGDTFGNDAGRYQIMDAFTDPDDAELLRIHLNGTSGYDANWRSKVVPWEAKYFDRTYRIPWAGYFEHLEAIEIYTVIVGHTQPSKW